MNESMANLILEKVIDTGEKLAGVSEKVDTVAEIVDKHDNITFPNIERTLIRMESKQNKDIALFTKKEEELRANGISLESRVKGLEDHNRLKQMGRKVFFGKIYETLWVWIQKFGVWIVIAILMTILGYEKTKNLISLIK